MKQQGPSNLAKMTPSQLCVGVPLYSLRSKLSCSQKTPAWLRHCQVANLQLGNVAWEPGNLAMSKGSLSALGCLSLPTLPSSFLKVAQGQQLLGLAHLGWQPGNVDFAAFSDD
jgi:hypothetical protein